MDRCATRSGCDARLMDGPDCVRVRAVRTTIQWFLLLSRADVEEIRSSPAPAWDCVPASAAPKRVVTATATVRPRHNSNCHSSRSRLQRMGASLLWSSVTATTTTTTIAAAIDVFHTYL